MWLFVRVFITASKMKQGQWVRKINDTKSLPFIEDSVRWMDMDSTSYLDAYGQYKHCHSNRTGE